MHSLIDADIIVYRSAFAAQEMAPDGSLSRVDSVEDAIKGAQMLLDSIIQDTWATGTTLYLTSNDRSNFRFHVATILPYKELRKAKEKPVHYEVIREYLIQERGAKVVVGMEADDALGIHQMSAKPNTTVICTLDKDLDMIPGLHYNFVTKQAYEALDPGKLILSDNRKSLRGTGLKWFYAQLLLGDKASDNIPGLHRCGPVKAFEILDPTSTEGEMMEVVWRAFLKVMPAQQARDYILEIAQLLWIRRFEDENITVHLKGLQGAGDWSRINSID